jgi:hypothetical protein
MPQKGPAGIWKGANQPKSEIAMKMLKASVAGGCLVALSLATNSEASPKRFTGPLIEIGPGTELHGPLTVRSKDGAVLLKIQPNGYVIWPVSRTSSR